MAWRGIDEHETGRWADERSANERWADVRWADERSANERYIDSMHRLGRWGSVGALLIMLGMPTFLGLCFDSLPSLTQIIQAALPLLIVFLPSNLFEVITYTPILGSSIYLALTTGEVINLKLPVVNSVFKDMDVEAGTVDADVISSIAISIASLVVMVIVTIGIVLAVPLRPILALPAVAIASNNLLPAVLGSLLVSMLLTSNLGGNVYAKGRLKGLILPVAILALLVCFDTQISVFFHLDTLLGRENSGVLMSVLQGFIIIVILPIAYFNTKWLFKRGKIKVEMRKQALGALGQPPDPFDQLPGALDISDQPCGALGQPSDASGQPLGALDQLPGA
ncbi:MAG: hypothetical protein LBH64_03910, partial [Coriobacteriales bacterium]|nr:hypothetical protein [Coriobacteriales bacterium]